MTGLSLADVVAVLSQPRNQIILALSLGGIAYLLRDAWQHRPKRKSHTPEAFRSIPVIVHPYVVTLTGSGRKGFEHRATVVDLAARRRNRSIH